MKDKEKLADIHLEKREEEIKEAERRGFVKAHTLPQWEDADYDERIELLKLCNII